MPERVCERRRPEVVPHSAMGSPSDCCIIRWRLPLVVRGGGASVAPQSISEVPAPQLLLRGRCRHGVLGIDLLQEASSNPISTDVH